MSGHRVAIAATGAMLLLLLAVIVFDILAPSSPELPEDLDNVGQLEAYLKRLVGSGNPPSLSVAVVRDARMIYSHGFGVADGPRRKAATADTMYNWWSLTKIFTAAAVLQLHERGQLHIDDPVRKYLPFFRPRQAGDKGEPVKIRNLLNHSSGLPDAGLSTYGWIHREDEPRPTQSEFARRVLPDYGALKYVPGTQGVYTNVGYLLLGAIVEAVADQSYEDYVLEHMLRPLGMARTGFALSDETLPFAAVGSQPVIDFQTLLLPAVGNPFGYVREIDRGQIWFNRYYSDLSAGGGLIGPATDCARFIIAYLNGGAIDGGSILSPATIALMSSQGHVKPGRSRPARQYPGMKHGLGWFVISGKQDSYLQHTGSGPGFSSIMRLYPEHSLGVVILMNGTSSQRNGIVDLIAQLYW